MHKRVIDERFELVERLGGGGMGLVWRAWDVALHREVALKEVRPPDPAMDEHDPAAGRELRARVLREARALARLNHPHVATIHHIVDPGEQTYPWIVMELVTGGSLQDRLQRGPMTPLEVARLGREVLSALRAAHAVGIQHRDVKPANVLLREDGRSVLTDFGIAAVRESTSLTATGSFIGSPEYMAPERINGVEGDPASDLWSLGMLLYVAVEGRHPLRRSTTLATLAAVLNQDVPPAGRAGALTPVLAALLRRDPAARPDPDTLDRMLAAAADPTSTPLRPGGMQQGGIQQGGIRQGEVRQGEVRQGGSQQGPMGPGPMMPGSPVSGGGYAQPSGSGGGYAQPSGSGGGYAQPSGSGGGYAQPSGSAGGHGRPTQPPMAGGPHTVPPGYAHPGRQPPPWGAAPVAKADTMNSRRSRGPARTVTAAVATAVVVVAGVLVWRLLPPLFSGEDPGALRATTGTSGEADPTRETDPTRGGDDVTPRSTPATENLHSPAGMRALIAKIKTVTGGSTVVRMTVYPTYASIQAPIKNDKEIYDTYMYREGQFTRAPMGGKVDGPVVDLDKYNWNALPALLKKATNDLGVPKPTSRYLIVDPNYVFTSPSQVLLVYASDGYRSGYLVANLRGKVVKTYADD
ncbi:protein kinase domain-containing protein [Nonomuraea sp. NPDC002799]